MTELKPCPFCGGDAELVEHNGGLVFYSVSCKNENCFAGAADVRHFSKETLVEAWNTRADHTSYRAVPEGYLVVPVPDKTVTQISIASGRLDMTDCVDTYSRVLEKHVQDEIVTKSLENCGYIKERTCHFRNDGHGILWCDAEGCDYDMDDCFPIPNYCPNCGCKVDSSFVTD